MVFNKGIKMRPCVQNFGRNMLHKHYNNYICEYYPEHGCQEEFTLDAAPFILV